MAVGKQQRVLDWASDTTPSMPVAPSVQRLVPMGGFCFTADGIAHDLSSTDVEELSVPPYGPPVGSVD